MPIPLLSARGLPETPIMVPSGALRQPTAVHAFALVRRVSKLETFFLARKLKILSFFGISAGSHEKVIKGDLPTVKW